MHDSIMFLAIIILIIGLIGIILSGLQCVNGDKSDNLEATLTEAKNRLIISGLIFGFAIMTIMFVNILEIAVASEAEQTIVVDDLYVREVVNARGSKSNQCVVTAGKEQYLYEANDMKEARVYCENLKLNSRYRVVYMDAGNSHYYIKEIEKNDF